MNQRQLQTPSTSRLTRRRRQATALVAIGTAAALVAGRADSARAAALFDNLTNALSGSSTGLLSLSGATPNTYIGDSYVLAIPGAVAGATPQFTGLDVLPYNGTTAFNFSSLRITFNVWGSVNTGAVSAASPAFGNLLGTYATTITYNAGGGSGLAPNFYGLVQGNGTTTSGITLNTPLQLTNLSGGQLGISVNVQGSFDNVTYANYQSLTPLLTYNASPTTGALLSNGYFANTSNSAPNTTNGNFVDPERGTAPMLGLGTRVIGNNGVANVFNWVAVSGGAYEDASSWSPAAVPGANDSAVFNTSANSVTSSGYTVSVQQPEVVGDVFVRSDRVTIDLSTAETDFTDGSALTIARVLSVGVPANGSSGTRGFLTLANSSGTGFNVVRAASAVVGGGTGGASSLTVGLNNALIVNGNTSIGAMSTMTLQPGSAFLGTGLILAGTTNAWTAKLDVTTAPVALSGASLATVTNQAKVGAAGGTFTGQGITSSNASSDSAHLTGVGVIQNNQNGTAIYGNGTTLPLFGGELGVNPTDILIRYTYFGDANLDGAVNAADYTLVDAGFVSRTTGWLNGDFNYDGVVDGSDYALMDNAFNRQASNLSSGRASPTPAGLGGVDGRFLSQGLGGATVVGGNATAQFGSSPAFATPAVASVPEPTTLAFLGLLAGTPLVRRRLDRRALRN